MFKFRHFYPQLAYRAIKTFIPSGVPNGALVDNNANYILDVNKNYIITTEV